MEELKRNLKYCVPSIVEYEEDLGARTEEKEMVTVVYSKLLYMV